MSKNNIRKLQDLLIDKKLDAVIIVDPSNIQYYTGLKKIADPPMALYINSDGEKTLYVTVLEYYRARNSLPKDIEVVAVSTKLSFEDMRLEKSTLENIVEDIVNKHNRVGIDTKTRPPLSRIVEYKNNKIVNISDEIWRHRVRKERWEIDMIRKAVEITIKGIRTLVDNLNENITDTQLAGIFEQRVRLEGVEDYAFPPLILFKPENSYPHNLPVGKNIGKRDLVLVDVGVKINGYCSDLTRTVPWKRPSMEERKALEAVVEAVDEVLDKAEPGMKGSEIDSIARNVLKKHGLDKYFTHGLGHGLGIDVHEKPYLTNGSNEVIEENMVFTIEPGVYVPGRYGVRIEEDVVMTSRGLKVLSRRLERILYP